MKINELLKEKNIHPLKYEKKGKVTVISSASERYVYKDSTIDTKILNYLKSRNFDYMPKILEKKDYELMQYIDDLEIPKEQKMIDMIKLVSLLHSKTTHYKKVNREEYHKLYDELNGNLDYLYSHYTDLITIIESKVYPSPKELSLSKNISKIYDTIAINKKRLDSWQNLIKDKTKDRNVVIHGNLRLSHFKVDDKPYLISWDKAKIDSPVFDIYKLYNSHVLDFDFESLLELYEKAYPLKEDERKLFHILISMPDIIDLKGKEYDECKKINRMMEKIYIAEKLTSKEITKK